MFHWFHCFFFSTNLFFLRWSWWRWWTCGVIRWTWGVIWAQATLIVVWALGSVFYLFFANNYSSHHHCHDNDHWHNHRDTPEHPTSRQRLLQVSNVIFFSFLILYPTNKLNFLGFVYGLPPWSHDHHESTMGVMTRYPIPRGSCRHILQMLFQVRVVVIWVVIYIFFVVWCTFRFSSFSSFSSLFNFPKTIAF